MMRSAYKGPEKLAEFPMKHHNKFHTPGYRQSSRVIQRFATRQRFLVTAGISILFVIGLFVMYNLSTIKTSKAVPISGDFRSMETGFWKSETKGETFNGTVGRLPAGALV